MKSKLCLKALLLLMLAPAARAQLELKAGNFNQVWIAPGAPPQVSNPVPTPGQSASVSTSGGGSAATSTSAQLRLRYPFNAAGTIGLTHSIVATTFATGVPRYALGDEIMPPLVQADGVTPALANYWRPQPVLPGEILSGENTPRIPLTSVTVVSASTNSASVTVAATIPELVPGSTLLGQPITQVAGTSVTLAGNANTNVTGAAPFSITPATTYYFSRHAERTFAHQPGRVEVKWVAREPLPAGTLPNGLLYPTTNEIFAVSANTSRPIQTIFWTEGSFDGPKVQVTDGRIATVNPVFNALVPKAVAQEVSIPGNTPLTPNLSTLSFDKFNGVGLLHAYNVEGRLLVEFLGEVRNSAGAHEWVGMTVVEIKRTAPVSYPAVALGDEITPSNGDPRLIPSPVLSSQLGASYYGTQVRPDRSLAYYAERDTSPAKMPDDGEPLNPNEAFNKVVFYWMEKGDFNIQWPSHQDRYWLRWSGDLADYAHYTVDDSGSVPAEGISFAGGGLPQLVYQDDPAQTEVRLDLPTQRLFTDFSGGSDLRNRALLKFTSSSEIWYVNLYTQAESRATTRALDANGTDTLRLTTQSAAGLEEGMVVTGPGITGSVRVLAITTTPTGQFVKLSQSVSTDGTFRFTVESDAAAPIVTTAPVGQRIAPPAGHEFAGHISLGTAYYPQAYQDPFLTGVVAANKGAIIPVNALPTHNQLHVRWFRRIHSPSASFSDLYVPGKIGRYTLTWPAAPPEIIIAQGVGTDDLPAAMATGSVYVQNDSTRPGYNPNEEHALMLGGRAWALREDLNVITGAAYTSEPFVLVAYEDPADQRPAMRAWRVLRTNAQYDFDYNATAGTLLVKPYPLPLMEQPLIQSLVNGTQRWVSKDREVQVTNLPANTAFTTNPVYSGFTFQDRKGFTWVHRGPHDTGSPTLTMELYYTSRAGFYIPGLPTQPPVGTILPFLRNAARKGFTLNPEATIDRPLSVVYRPVWPQQAPELRVGETLALPKFGLPQVRGQVSAQVLYEQSLAKDTTNSLTKNSVTLHDATREKTVILGTPNMPDKIPDSIRTTSYRGRTYIQGLPPHLQQRIYVDPLRGPKGTLVFLGTFHDVIAGEDYLDLNVLTAAEETLLKELPTTADTRRTQWIAAIDALQTTVETFRENSAKRGTYAPSTNLNRTVEENDLAVITDPDTAVDSYALTATGRGQGFVTMVFGNGFAFTPEGDPVHVKVFKVAPQLYTGDLKVVQSSNPLDEQVTLRHSGDFAGKPEHYDFEWRWTTGAATAPSIYTTTMTTRVGSAFPSTNQWRIVTDPGTALPSSYPDAAVQLPRSVVVHPTTWSAADIAAGYPAQVLKAETAVNFSTGVPGNIVFSADLGALDGCVLYVNGTPAIAYNAPASFTAANATSGLSAGGLPLQFSVAPSFFTAGANTLQVAVFSRADVGVSSSIDFRLEAAQETDAVVTGSTWQTVSDPTGVLNTNQAIVGGTPTNPFGGSTFVLNDRWFTMRYKPKASANNVLGSTTWSRWMPPQFVEGWVKRVLAAINPFEQRVKDLFNNAVNTDISLLTQAGKRWEGDIALTLENVNGVGLIEIYETVLNRAKALSIDANTNDPDSNNALLLAAGYLNDLYTLLGNEAFADAANPTISVDDEGSATQVNTSRFSFEGQVATSLEEELALLRGRDDSVSPGVGIAPAYNRLYWNYTRGINSGEAIYALSYNIKEKAGSSTANGVIDESDAQRMFPQGHGDAYGHYLTALKGYYKLLTNPNYTWTPRAEAVTVLGQPVTVDYVDERKFAAAAGNLARTAEQILALTWRQVYRDNPAAGWSHLRDNRAMNPQTAVTPEQGMDEWASRSAQGALYHWAVANAILPATDLVHTGIQKIDRTTVPELSILSSALTGIQTIADNVGSRLNPLGLSPDAIAFDIAPAKIMINILEGGGSSHYQQVAERALTALNNAAGAFNQAASMTGALRNQENSVDEFNTALVEQERAFTSELISIYGQPYAGDIGPGRSYAQGYHGPDLLHWFVVDRPASLEPTTDPTTISVKEWTQVPTTTVTTAADIVSATNTAPTVTTRTLQVEPSQFVQFKDVWGPTLGNRPETGELQDALLDAHATKLALLEFNTQYQRQTTDLAQMNAVFRDMVSTHLRHEQELASSQEKVLQIERLVRDLQITSGVFSETAELTIGISNALAETAPTVLGLAADTTSTLRGAIEIGGHIVGGVLRAAALSINAAARYQETNIVIEEQNLEKELTKLGFKHEQVQFAYEYQVLFREVHTRTGELSAVAMDHQRALQNVKNILSRSLRVLEDRELFRQRAAAVVQGYRVRDITFRLFRNEALEQYRSLFDLAGRYTYLAAKSYDYETGLLGSTQGQEVFRKIVSSRALGDLTDGTPQLTASVLGDGGLASPLGRLNADYSVAEGRLGINNPDLNGTVFSLRTELFRLLNDGRITSDDEAWQQTLEQHITANLLTDSDVAAQCRNLRKPDGTPVPGLIIPFSTSILHGKNFFGLDLAAGDHAFTPSNFATRIFNAGIALPGYIGMQALADGSEFAGAPVSAHPHALGATPYVYLIPCGNDYMLAPPLGDTNTLRSWKVQDQALPLPFNLGANDFNSTQFFNANGTLSEQPWVIRKHQAFRAVDDPSLFAGDVPMNFTSSRLIGRSAWNGQWKLVIPAYTLLSNEQEGLNRFAASVQDIQLFLRTYSNSGN
jgi:hypothetical protein